MPKQSPGAYVCKCARDVMQSARLSANLQIDAIIYARKAKQADCLGDQWGYYLLALLMDVCAAATDFATSIAIGNYRYALSKYDTPRGRMPYEDIQ